MKNIIKKKIINFAPWYFYSNKIYKLYLKGHKLNEKCVRKRQKIYGMLSYYYYYKMYSKYKCQISPKADLLGKIVLPHPIGIIIGEMVRIGKNVTIYQNVTIGRKDKNTPEYPIIEDNVTIYCNSIILGNIRIGNGAIIGAGSLVLRDVKPGEIVYGVVK